MEKITALLFLVQLVLSCSGVNSQSAYSESGLNGAVKKETSYILPIKKYGEIPTDTINFESRIVNTYDSLGNLMKGHNFYQHNYSQTEYITKYSGTGKNRTFTLQYLSGIEDTTVKSYKYVWSDDYHFTIFPTDKNDALISINTLDKKFRIIESVFKKGDTIRIVDEFEYEVKNNKIIEKTTKRTYEEGKTDGVVYIVTVIKEFDEYGNPTLVYFYDNDDKKRITNVGFTFYEYYDDKKTNPKNKQ